MSFLTISILSEVFLFFIILSSRFRTSSKRTEVAYERGHISIIAGITTNVVIKYNRYCMMTTESKALLTSKPIVYPKLIITNKITMITSKTSNSTGPR